MKNDYSILSLLSIGHVSQGQYRISHVLDDQERIKKTHVIAKITPEKVLRCLLESIEVKRVGSILRRASAVAFLESQHN